VPLSVAFPSIHEPANHLEVARVVVPVATEPVMRSGYASTYESSYATTGTGAGAATNSNTEGGVATRTGFATASETATTVGRGGTATAAETLTRAVNTTAIETDVFSIP
jgi:hypothetical protein